MSDWHELETIERRRRPRLEERFGTCPICGLNATAAYLFNPLTWSACDTCMVRWSVGRVLDPPETAAIQELHLAALMAYAEAPAAAVDPLARVAPLQPITQEIPMKTTPAEQHPTFNIHLLPKIDGAEYEGKDLLRLLPPLAVVAISGACLSVLYSHPHARKADVDRLSFEVWDFVRDLAYDDQGRTCGAALQAAGTPPLFELQRILRLLLAAGDLRATLLKQRAQIDAALQQLEWCQEVAR